MIDKAALRRRGSGWLRRASLWPLQSDCWRVHRGSRSTYHPNGSRKVSTRLLNNWTARVTRPPEYPIFASGALLSNLLSARGANISLQPPLMTGAAHARNVSSLRHRKVGDPPRGPPTTHGCGPDKKTLELAIHISNFLLSGSCTL